MVAWSGEKVFTLLVAYDDGLSSLSTVFCIRGGGILAGLGEREVTWQDVDVQQVKVGVVKLCEI